MDKTPFGEELRREREMRGVTLEEISTATRISVRFLEALENARWDQLPGGVFNRGFIRAVARFLGLDEESLIAQYVCEFQDRTETSSVRSEKPFPGRATKIVIMVAIFIGIAALGWAGYKLLARRRARWIPAASASGLPRTAGKSGVSSSPSAPGRTTRAVPAASSSIPTDAIGTPAPLAPQEAILELNVEAGKPCEVSVSADGAAQFSGSMQPGDKKLFRARQSLEISASDSSAVLVELNGQMMPPLGPSGQPGKMTLTRKSLNKP